MTSANVIYYRVYRKGEQTPIHKYRQNVLCKDSVTDKLKALRDNEMSCDYELELVWPDEYEFPNLSRRVLLKEYLEGQIKDIWDHNPPLEPDEYKDKDYVCLDMTDNEVLAKLAEADGLYYVDIVDQYDDGYISVIHRFPEGVNSFDGGPMFWHEEPVPDYIGDLNVIQGLIDKLFIESKDDLTCRYEEILRKICGKYICRANARQRAQALYVLLREKQ